MTPQAVGAVVIPSEVSTISALWNYIIVIVIFIFFNPNAWKI